VNDARFQAVAWPIWQPDYKELSQQKIIPDIENGRAGISQALGDSRLRGND